MLRRSYLIIGLLLIFVSIAITVGCAIQMKKADVATKESVNETNEKLEDRPLHTAEKPDLKVLFKDVNGDVQLIRGDERIRVTEQMETPLEPEDRVITGKNTTVSMFFHDETSVYFEPESELKLLHWSREETYDHIAIQNVSGKLVNDVKTGDKYIVHFEDDYIEVKGTMFLTGIENRFPTLMVIDGIVKWVHQNKDSEQNDSKDVFLENIPMFFLIERDRERKTFNIDYVELIKIAESMHLQTITAMIRSMIDTRDSVESSNELSVIDAIKLNDLIEIARNRNLLSDDEIAEIEEIEEKYKDILEFARNFNFEDSPLADILKNIQDNALGNNSEKVNEELLASLMQNFYSEIANIQEQYVFHREQTAEFYKEIMERKNEDINRVLNKEAEIEEKKRQLIEQVERERQRLQEEKQQREQEALDRLNREREEERNSRTPPNVNERERPSPEDRLLRFMWEPIINHTASIGDTLKIPLNVNPDDAELTIRSSDLNIASAKIIDKVIHIEALREGNAVIQLTLEKAGYRTETISFNVNVSITNQLPFGKFLYIPNNQNLQFNDGIIVDLMKNKRNNESKIRVEEILPQFPDTMKRAGKVVNISFENLTINEPVRLVFPVNQRENADQLGIFHQEPDGSWRYLPSTITLRGIQAFTSDFSAFGVFSAHKLTLPSSSEVSEEVPRYTEVVLEADEGAEIYYTTNGATPTENSKLYEKPIVIDKDMTIKAIAIANNHLPSDVASFTYTVPKEYPVTFIVTDGKHVLKDAVVTVGESELVTGNDGLVTFFLPNGTYEYVIEAEGYISTTGTIVVENGSINEVITLQREKYEVTLVVTDGNNPIYGAEVTIEGNVETSDAAGIVKFSLPDGLYHYQVEAKGFEAWKDSVAVLGEAVEETIVLVLAKHQVSFTVSDRENPILGAKVTVNEVTKTTNAEGRATFSLVKGIYDYTIEAIGFKGVSSTLNIIADTEETITLKALSHEVIFTIKDGETPITNATVKLDGVALTSDEAGKVNFSLLNGSYDYTVEAEGYESFVGEIIVENEPINKIVTLEKLAYEVVIFVTDGENPIENAKVRVNELERLTDKEGKVTYMLPQGEYNYFVEATGYKVKNGKVNVVDRPFEKEVTLKPVEHEVSILVKDGDNLISGATVTIDDLEETSNEEGKVKFLLPNGDYSFTVIAEGYEKSSGNIKVSNESVEKTVALNPKKEQITFTVTDGEKPIENVQINIGEYTDSTNANGQVIFHLPNGTYEFSVEASGYVVENGIINVVGSPLEEKITLNPVKYGVSILVKDGDNLISGATVTIDNLEATSNDEGIVNFSLPNGSYNYSIVVEGYEKSNGNITVDNGAVEEIVGLELTKYNVTITVTYGDVPIENAIIKIGDVTKVSGDDGTVKFLLPSGDHLYTIIVEGFEELSEGIEVPGEDTDRTVTLIPKKELITFTVTDGEKPISNATIYFGSYEGNTDEHGKVYFYVPSGFYEYLIEAEGYDTASDSFEVENQSIEKEVVLQLDSEIYKVSITITNGMFPIPEATLTINGQTKKIDSEGNVSFDLPSGIHELIAQAENYQTYKGTFEISSSDQQFEIVLGTTYYQVVFKVTGDGTPIEGFELCLEHILGQTDINGEIFFSFPSGIYRYKITNEGYEGIEGDVEVIDKDVNVYLELSELRK